MLATQVPIIRKDDFDREKFAKWWEEMEKKPISYGKEVIKN